MTVNSCRAARGGVVSSVAKASIDVVMAAPMPPLPPGAARRPATEEMLGELVTRDLETPAHHAVAAATSCTVTIYGIMRLADPRGGCRHSGPPEECLLAASRRSAQTHSACC
jgi:hypothetical protein